jgi:hypothetical protein
VQNFQGGRVERFTNRVRQDVFLGGAWRATYYFQTSIPGECPDVSGDILVDFSDALEILAHFGETEGGVFDPRYDLTRDGLTDLTVAGIAIEHFGQSCVI